MKQVGFSWAKRGSCTHPEIMTLKGGKLGNADYPSYVGIIRHPEQGVILFDTGYDPEFYAATDTFPERFYRWATPVKLDRKDSAENWLAAQGIGLEDVTTLILSHFHGDHIAGLKSFPNARIFCSSAGLRQIQSGNRFSRVRQGLLAGLLPADIATRATFFEDLAPVALPSEFGALGMGVDVLGDGSLLAMELKGHCVGHWGLALQRDDGRDVLLIADAAWSIGAVERGVPPPSITTNLLGDTVLYRETLSILQRVANTNLDLAVLPSHCSVAAARLNRD